MVLLSEGGKGGGCKGMGFGGKGSGGQGYASDPYTLQAMQLLQMMGFGDMGGQGFASGGGGFGGQGFAGGGGQKGSQKGKNGWGKKGNAQGTPKNKANPADMPWKSRLNQALQKVHKADMTADSIVYSTSGEPGEGFATTVSSDKFTVTTEYESEGTAATKKQAEENAAMVAMKSEFPALFQSAPKAAKKAGEDLSAKINSNGPKAVKQGNLSDKEILKRALGESHGQDPKSLLNQNLTIIIGRSLLKEDVEFTGEVIDEMACRATCVIHCTGDEARTFTGKKIPGVSKADRKMAEQSAAEMASKALKQEIAEAMPAYLAKKEEKHAEKRAAFEAKIIASGGEVTIASEPPAKKMKISPTSESAGSASQDSKCQLLQAIAIIIGRTIAKGDVEFDVADVGGAAVKATCTINCTEDAPRTFKGKQIAGISKANKKAAEQSAADIALKAYKEEIAAAMPGHLARKEEKQAEREAKILAGEVAKKK